MKSLVLGLILAFGSFGIKSGAGLFYVIKHLKGTYKKGLVFFLFALMYLVIFEVFYRIIGVINFFNYINIIQVVLQYAMLVHIIIAGGLFFWGIYLLTRITVKNNTHAWLIMIIPCPVCLIVVFLTTSFVMSFFPAMSHIAVFLGYIVFILLAFVTNFFMHMWKLNYSLDDKKKLGIIMVIIAVYFVLSILFGSIFKDVDKIYRLSLYRTSATVLDNKECIILGMTVIISFSIGFIYKLKKISGVIR